MVNLRSCRCLIHSNIKNKQYGGVGLLNPTCIKSISADVSRYLGDYNRSQNECRNKNLSLEELKDKIGVCRNVCLQHINSIINHHCGNHDFCDKSHCKYRAIQFEVETTHKVMGNNEICQLAFAKEVGN